jgi:hypothetical protein
MHEVCQASSQPSHSTSEASRPLLPQPLQQISSTAVSPTSPSTNLFPPGPDPLVFPVLTWASGLPAPRHMGQYTNLTATLNSTSNRT